GLVAVVAVFVLGPALIQSLGDRGAKTTAALIGVLARATAGALAAAPARRRGLATRPLLASVALGSFVGYLAFPGTLAIAGSVAAHSGVWSYLGLLGSALLTVVTGAAGALAPRPRAGFPAPASDERPVGGDREGERPATGSQTRLPSGR
ncbi:MAG: hypothetical protein P8Z68_10425, partial [Kineosporiaceae bacterium]